MYKAKKLDDGGNVKMESNKDGVRLGEGVSDDLKQNVNKELSDIGKLLIRIVSKYVKEKIQDINLDELFCKKNEEDLLNLWSTELMEKDLVCKAYEGLPDSLLIDNLHQEGYLDGMYVGYALAMMSLIDNGAPKDLILNVRDDIRSNLIGHHYNNKNEFIELFKNEKYSLVDNLSEEDESNV